MPAVTAKEVAELANVSIGTVSRVFNNHQNVNQETRQKVLKIASELGYLKTNKQGTPTGSNSRQLKQLGFLFYSPSPEGEKNSLQSNPFWSAILHGVENEADKMGVGVTYKQIGRLVSNPQLLLNTVYEMRLGGILLVGPADAQTVNILNSSKIPLVLVDNYLPKAGVDAVLGNNFEGAQEAVEHLIENGHSKIAFIGGPRVSGTKSLIPVNSIYTFEQRSKGYRQALEEAGIQVDYDLFEESDISAEGGYEACKRLLARKADFTAIFCGNDPIAIGAMRALREADLKVPQDVSLIGFDDISLAEHLNPALSTVRVDKETMGASAVRCLIERVTDPLRTTISSILTLKLIKRGSVTTCRR